jgi:hypothetical protein
MVSADNAERIARELTELVSNPPKEVLDRMRARLEERRKGMPRGVSAAVLHTRMGY